MTGKGALVPGLTWKTHRNPTMSTPIESLVAAGTKVWLDSVDPAEVVKNRALGATGATSNPIIISGLIATGRFDSVMVELIKGGADDTTLAWEMTNKLVQDAQNVFLPVWA